MKWWRKLWSKKLKSRPTPYTVETHSGWVVIRENGKLVFEGHRSWMPKKVRKRYDARMRAIDRVWRLIPNLDDFMESMDSDDHG